MFSLKRYAENDHLIILLLFASHFLNFVYLYIHTCDRVAMLQL